MNDATLVLTHSADLDGVCSQAIARKALGNRAVYTGWDYGQPVPDLSPYTTVYLIDISLPREAMAANIGKLIWLDHHQSAIQEMADLPIRGCRIDGVAACRIAWQWLINGETHAKEDYLGIDAKVREPYAVRLLGLYDVWQKDHEHVDLFQLGMQAEKAPDWDALLTTDAYDNRGILMAISPSAFLVSDIIERGRAVQSYTEVTNTQIIRERGFDVTWEGLRWRALNIARCNSMTFTAALTPEHDGCLGYFWNGKKWNFSLYHAPGKEHHDLSAIAKKHGGGGHRGACGFKLTQLPTAFGGWPVQFPLTDGYILCETP